MPVVNGKKYPYTPAGKAVAKKAAAKTASQSKMKATPKPKATTKPPTKKVNPERLLQQYLNQGMSLNNARKKVSNETGVWPNGYTN